MTETVTGATGIRVEGLGKRYSRRRGSPTEALRDCSFELPAGKVGALIGANGAGKTTLLAVLSGLLKADSGTVVTGGRTAFVAQDKPVYRSFKPLEVLDFAARLNLVWDGARAQRWLERFDVPLDQACGRLSGGQRSQVAFAVAIGSRPDLLLLDEPLADLDPLVRREVTAELLSEVERTGMTMLLSTHTVTELGGVADHLLLLAHGRLLVGGDLDEIVAAHLRYTGPRADRPPFPGEVIQARHSSGQSSFVVRLDGPAPPVSAPWVAEPVSLEEFVLAQLAATRAGEAA